MATFDEMLSGLQQPQPLPPVDPNIPTAQAGSQMATMGAIPSRVQPPASPEEFNARTNGWMQALDALRNNPQAAQALMFFGARMLQGRRPGQTTGGALGEAAFGGMQMYGALQQNEQDAQRQAEKDALDAESRRAQIESNQATTANTRQKTKLEAEDAPTKRREAEATAKWKEAEARVQAARAAGLEAQDPAQMAKLELDLAKLKLASEQALIAARNRSNQDPTPKDKPGKVTVHQTKGDDGRIYRTVRDNGVESFEAITPAMSRMDAMAEAKAEWTAEHGTGWTAPSPTPEWLNERVRFHMTPRVEQVGGEGPPTKPAAPAGKPTKEVDRATLKAAVEGRRAGAEVKFERQAPTKPEGPPGWAKGKEPPPETSYAVKQKMVNRGAKYYVEGDPIPGNSYEFEADAKERARVLRARQGK
jgi:hypothetical protein